MLNIDTKSVLVIGAGFYKTDPHMTYICIGYGQDPTSGANYIVGKEFDSTNNRTTIKTFLFREVTFVGQLLTPS